MHTVDTAASGSCCAQRTPRFAVVCFTGYGGRLARDERCVCETLVCSCDAGGDEGSLREREGLHVFQHQRLSVPGFGRRRALRLVRTLAFEQWSLLGSGLPYIYIRTYAALSRYHAVGVHGTRHETAEWLSARLRGPWAESVSLFVPRAMRPSATFD